jgi:hypothetical protein
MREAKRQGGGLRTDLGRVGGAGDEVWTIRRAVANRDENARPTRANAWPTPSPCATAVLLSQARATISTNPQVALQFAEAAHHLDPTPESDETLLQLLTETRYTGTVTLHTPVVTDAGLQKLAS